MGAAPERAGYTVSVFAVDVSPSMGETIEDADTGQSKSKLDWAKEYVARKMDTKVCSPTFGAFG
jgi:ATP-dependent DNA helicase 2 subunit 2